MANTSPATLTVTSTTGAGQSVAAAKFTDVTDIEVNFQANTLKVTHGNVISYFDYSAILTLTWTISGGVTTIVTST